MIDITELSSDSLQLILDAAANDSGYVDVVTELISDGKSVVEVKEVERETEKAVRIYGQYHLPKKGSFTGDTLNSFWLPKSQIKETVLQDGVTVHVLKPWIAHKLSSEVKSAARR
jgi:LysM repeat protein